MAIPVENDDYKQKEIAKLKRRNGRMTSVKARLKSWIL